MNIYSYITLEIVNRLLCELGSISAVDKKIGWDSVTRWRYFKKNKWKLIKIPIVIGGDKDGKQGKHS